MCSEFVSDVSIFEKGMLLFVDESGVGKHNILRKYSFSLRGKPAVSSKQLSRGQHLSLIACMSAAGVMNFDIVEGSMEMVFIVMARNFVCLI